MAMQARVSDSKSAQSEDPSHNNKVRGASYVATAIAQAGNLSVQQVLAGNGQRRDPQSVSPAQQKVSISKPQDPLERQADAVADAVIRGETGAARAIGSAHPSVQRACHACDEEASLQRKESSTSQQDSLPLSRLQRLGSGRPLPDHTRQYFENHLQRDFTDVRIHTTPYAGTLAKDIHAKAFTHKNNIAFANGQYNPHSHEGKHLLAHELTHTVQQQGHTVYREGDGTDLTESDTNSSEATPEWSFDPYAENVVELTNGGLEDAILFTDDWLAENLATHTDHEAYTLREGRLEEERQRRIGMGHVWLELVKDRQSHILYQLITQANGAVDVVAVDNDELIHGVAQDLSATPIMTASQFQASLGAQGVPSMPVAEYQAELEEIMAIGGDEHALDLGLGVTGAVAQYSVRNRLLMDAFANHSPQGRSGAIAEAFALSSRDAFYGFGVADRNRMSWTHPTAGPMSGNFPVSDAQTFFGLYPPEGSVKMRMAQTGQAASPSAITNFGTYLEGYAQMLGVDPTHTGFDHFMNAAGGGRSPADVRADFGLIIPADDVDAFRNLLSDPTARDFTPSGNVSDTPNYQRADLQRIYDGLLRDAPIHPGDGGAPITTIQQLDAALASGRIGVMQHDMLLRQIGADASSRVHANTDFTMATHLAFEQAFQQMHESFRPVAPTDRPILHTSTRDRTSAIANSQSGIERYGNYLNRLGAVIPEGTGALHIDADDVDPLRNMLRDPLGRDTTPSGGASRTPNFQRAQLAGIYNALLQQAPLTAADGSTYSTVEALHSAFEAGNLTASDYQNFMNDLGNRAANQVQPRTTDVVQAHEQAMAQYRQRRAAYRQQLREARAHIRAGVSPEFTGSLAHGGGFRGDLRMARGYGRGGALMGGGMAALQELWSMGTDGRDNPDALQRLGSATGREALRGGSSAYLEAVAASQASRMTLRYGLTQGSSRALAMRLGSRFAPGGLVDMGFEGWDMAMDNRANSSEEISYRLGRAFVIGGSSALAGAYAGAAAGTAIGTVVPGVGNVVGFIVGLAVGVLVGAVVSSLIPSYEDLVREQVPLKEFENNLQAQTPISMHNQILAQQEYDLLMQYMQGPESRGPYDMANIYDLRNHSTSPGQRIWAEALLGDRIHGGCQDCHTQKEIPAIDSQFPDWHPARTTPVDRMAVAALQEYGNTQPRPQFLGYDMPDTYVDPTMQQGLRDLQTGAEMAHYINIIRPNIGAWRNVLGTNRRIIPTGLMNLPLNEQQLYEYMQQQVDRRQTDYEDKFGEVGEEERSLYRSWIEASQ